MYFGASSSSSSSSSASLSLPLENEKRFYHYQTEKEATYIIEKDKILGKGGQASMVIEAHDKNNDKNRAAVKIYTFDKALDSDSLKELKKDLCIECQNLFVMGEFLGLVEEENAAYLFMKLHPGENLLSSLYEVSNDESKLEFHNHYYIAKSELSFSDKLNLTLNSIQSVINLHEKNLIHRDIATTNFMFEKTGNAHSKLICMLALIDLGSARQADLETKDFVDPTRHFQGHFGYFAPELIHLAPNEKPRFNFKTDYFGLGIVLAEIWTTLNFQQALYDLKTGLPIFSSACADDIKTCLRDVFFQDCDDYLLRKEIFDQRERDILEEILLLIHELCQNNPDARPILEELKEKRKKIEQLRKNYLKPNRKPSNAPQIPRLKLEALSLLSSPLSSPLSPPLSPLSPRKETVIYSSEPTISLSKRRSSDSPHFSLLEKFENLESPRFLLVNRKKEKEKEKGKEEKEEKKKIKKIKKRS